MIDRYLRSEMSAQESENFDRQVVKDVTLRREVALVSMISSDLAARQRKLEMVRLWSGGAVAGDGFAVRRDGYSSSSPSSSPSSSL